MFLVLAAFGLIFAVSQGWIKLPKVQQAVVQPSAPSEVPFGCPDTLTTNLKVAARNPLNASLEYLAATFKIVDPTSNQIIGTVTGSSSGLGSATSVECGRTYVLYYLGDGTYTSVKKTVTANGATEEVYIDLPKSSELQYTVYKAYSNITQEWGQDVTTSTQTFNSGTTETYTVKIRVKDSAAQFGADGLTVYLCADFNTAKFSKTNGVIVSGLSTIDVPSGLQAQGMDKCWVMTPIKSTEGERELSIQLKADLGDPGASDDVTFYIYDSQYYQKNDGTIGIGPTDDAYSLVGEVDRAFTFDIA